MSRLVHNISAIGINDTMSEYDRVGRKRLFMMKQLPTQEYKLMRAMMTKYNLDDPSELFTCLLRLGYEVMAMQHGTVDNGLAWWASLVQQYRDMPDELRHYDI